MCGMRILYIDIDALRPDHLGCYGYHRQTSPAVDEIARAGVRFNNVYVSDAPCLPSRTALFSGRYGVHTGVVDHEGVAADYRHEGAARPFRSTMSDTCWMQGLRNLGYHTVSLSPFAERHSAWWYCAGFSEIHNTGKRGAEIADEVEPAVLGWLDRNAGRDNWFMHLNIWDPHNPYRTPADFGNPFEGEPIPEWYSEEVRRQHWEGCGPESAQDAAEFQELCRAGWENHHWRHFPRQPLGMDSMDQVRRMFDGYDIGVRYADLLVEKVVASLKSKGLYDDTAIIISSDHGEDLGELNVYACHHTADEAVCHIPLIVKWPGVTEKLAGRALDALHCHVDLAATVLKLAGGTVPGQWDGQSFDGALLRGADEGRPYVVSSQMTGACQRTIRFDQYLAIRTYHDGYHCYPEWMLFDVVRDRHMQRDLASERPADLARAAELLELWRTEALPAATGSHDPLHTVLEAGGGIARQRLSCPLLKTSTGNRSRRLGGATRAEASHGGGLGRQDTYRL